MTSTASTTLIDHTKGLPARKAFAPDGRQLAWDSTSLGAAKKCPRYYQYSIVEGWRPKLESPHLKFGILFHSALERLDHIRVERKWEDADLRTVLRWVMNEAGMREQDGDATYFKPWISLHDKKNLESLIRAVVWYFDQYRDDALSPVRLSDGRAAVELSFRFPLPLRGRNDEELLYCGHLDYVGEYGGQYYITDRKTTGGPLGPRFTNQFSPSVQITGYTFAGTIITALPISGMIIDAMQVGAGFARFARFPMHVTKGQMEEWLQGALYTIQEANKWLDQGYWPMNETSCTMYDGCQFQGICSKDPGVRQRFLEAAFERRGWDPLQTRGPQADAV